jgi:hypothetical protein
VINETKIAEEILSGNYNGNLSKGKQTFLLAKYYTHKTQKKDGEIKELIHKHLKSLSDFYVWEMNNSYVEKVVRNAKKSKLIDINNVTIYESEIEQIRKIKDLNKEKVLFSYLIHAKIKYLMNEDTNGWVSNCSKDVFDAVGVNLTLQKREKIVSELINNGYLTTSGNTTQLYTDLPVIFTGVSMEAHITIGTSYYVRNVASSNTFTVSSTIGGGNINLAGNASPTSAMLANPVQYMYTATQDYDATTYERNVLSTAANTNIIELNNTTSLVTNAPIIFTDNIGGLLANTVYYIKSIPSPNITVSQSRTNGVADTVVSLSTDTIDTTATIYVGSDIWKRIVLTSW